MSQSETGSEVESGRRLLQPQHSSLPSSQRFREGGRLVVVDCRGDPARCRRRLTEGESQQEWASRSRSRAGSLRRSRVERGVVDRWRRVM